MTYSFSRGLFEWLTHGLWASASWWQILLATLVMTHVTISAVTIFLHRAQAHRALTLHPLPEHFLRFWLWLTTGMVTKEFVAVHRKHHAKCETEEDPHSPQTRGIKALLLTGVELYRAEAAIPATLAQYGRGTPDDWIERNLYSRYSWQGVGVMLVLDLFLFGAIGLSVWAVQMLWIPVMATGIINGIGHYWGYRNFEPNDASTNVSPWGIIIGGEELHNNHHTYPTSACFSVRPYEFDIGWMYIRCLEFFGLARVHRAVPKLRLGKTKEEADRETLSALIAHRYALMATYARGLRDTCVAEMGRARADGNTSLLDRLQVAKNYLHHDGTNLPEVARRAIEENGQLTQSMKMREELRRLWTQTNVSAEQLVTDLRDWCKRADASGIEALMWFSRLLRSAK